MTTSTCSYDSSFESLLADVAHMPVVEPRRDARPESPAGIRLEHRLGSGGMAEVWRGVDKSDGRGVAVKFLRGRASRWLVREAAALARLRHPRIVALERFGTTSNGTAYLVMELVHGASLAHHVRHVSRLDLIEARDLLRQLTDALDHAHAQGIVHRDVKPSNVMLTEGAQGIDARLIDFGICAAFELSGVSGRRAGTPGYMSPEQVRDLTSIDARADLWSLAATLHFGLTGRRADARVPGAWPAPIEQWFDRALHPDPRRRFSTAREMSRAFASACDALPDLHVRALCDAATNALVLQERTVEVRGESNEDFRRKLLAAAVVLVLWMAWTVLR